MNGVDAGDYTRWKDHFGDTSGAGASVGVDSAVVPEPMTCGLVLCAALGIFSVWRPRIAHIVS